MMEIRDNTHWIIMPKSQPSVHNILPDLHVLASIRPDQIPKSRQSAALSLGAALIHRASLHYWTGGRVAIWTPLPSQKKKKKKPQTQLSVLCPIFNSITVGWSVSADSSTAEISEHIEFLIFSICSHCKIGEGVFFSLSLFRRCLEDVKSS